MKDWSSQVHVKWGCKYHVVIVAKCRQKRFLGSRQTIWPFGTGLASFLVATSVPAVNQNMKPAEVGSVFHRGPRDILGVRHACCCRRWSLVGY